METSLVRCSECGQARILTGVPATFVRDAAAQGLRVPCLFTQSCPGASTPLAPPAPLAPRPPAARAGRHVAACPECQVPLLHDYLYGYGPGIEAAHCPCCGLDLSQRAWQDWPRCDDGAYPIDLRVNPVAPAKRQLAEGRMEVPTHELAPLLRQNP